MIEILTLLIRLTLLIDTIDTVDKRMLEYLKRVNLGKVCNPLLHLGNAQINTNTVGLP